MKLLNYAKQVVPCQRNWNEKFIMPSQHIDYIVDVATTMPSKNQQEVYELYVITNRNLINKIFEVSYHVDDTGAEKQYGIRRQNSQVRANLLLLWTDGPIKEEKIVDTLAIGISSGAAALAGAELGYKTGFCACFNYKEINRILGTEKNVRLSLGIGHPNENYNTRQIAIDNKHTEWRTSHGDKKIPIHRLV